VLIVAAIAALLGLRTVYSQLTPRPFHSFVVTETMSSPLAGSPLPYVRTFSIAVREDGSWVKITPIEHIAAEMVYERDIYDMQTGIWTTVDELSKSTLTREMSEHQMSTLANHPAASCGGRAAEKILGQDIQYIETADDSDERQMTVKKWMATGLGCVPLKQETIMKENRNGTWTPTVDTTLQAFSLVFEPVDQFFRVQNDYIERKPSEVYLERHRLYPKQFDSLPDMSGADEAYQRSHVASKN